MLRTEQIGDEMAKALADRFGVLVAPVGLEPTAKGL